MYDLRCMGVPAEYARRFGLGSAVMQNQVRPLRLDLILTRIRPMACVYCHMDHLLGVMSPRVWRKAVDLLLREQGPLELQLMGASRSSSMISCGRFDLRDAARQKRKALGLGVTTNGLLLTAKRAAGSGASEPA